MPDKNLSCSSDHPRYFTTDNEGNLIQLRDPREDGYFSCCYLKFERKRGSEMEIETATTCNLISSNVTKIPQDFEFILVKCLTTKNDITSYTLMDIFGLVPLKPLSNSRFIEPAGRKRVNVVIFGVDSVSHMNFMRNFKSSYAYLVNDLSAIGMWGYNKNADNTFPNTLPVLSGLSLKDLKRTGWNVSKFFDDVPFIWKNFSQEGYRTAFSEDANDVGIFRCEKRGFRDPPTDYYHHPALHAMDKQIGHTAQEGVANMCYGTRLSFEILLELMKKMATTMNKNKRYFHFTWATALTHDELNYGQFGDHLLLETLQWFKSGGYLNDTVLILMSDHGMRFGDIRSTLQGKIEDRMPFLYFVLPQWFQETYPDAVKRLRGNKRLLTTHFDLHETLKDLLHLNNIEKNTLLERQFKLATSRNVPRGISLFLSIPLTRTCDEAGLSSHWCLCRELKPLILEGNEIVIEGARQAVETLNGIISKNLQCHKFVFDSVLNAQVHHNSDDVHWDESEIPRDLNDPRLTKQKIRYNIDFKVRPSGGTYEATVTHHTDGSWEVSEEIDRTSSYGHQSRCMQDEHLKKYCYCG
ncbi:unnamed protein product [Allacma fusca]|uniref:DUF229 domain containing protein n=1 Tax=Allacma fusca TaxID=39272 RepID=A0A8J2K3X5_9HEXA|nr:unnamed protein product [Allacma fusca]